MPYPTLDCWSIEGRRQSSPLLRVAMLSDPCCISLPAIRGSCRASSQIPLATVLPDLPECPLSLGHVISKGQTTSEVLPWLAKMLARSEMLCSAASLVIVPIFWSQSHLFRSTNTPIG